VLFIALAKPRGTVTKREGTMRRFDYTYPEDMTIVGEYWLATDDPCVILMVEADAMAPLLTALADWDDVFTTTIIPAVTAEEGMRFAKDRLAQQELAVR
jgi:hypothetical protein